MITQEKLNEILELHSKWLDHEPEGERANLGGADLYCVDLRHVDLRDADLRCANLEGANLEGANLGRANLGRANLHHAKLEGANLYHANLRRADLGGANLRHADLGGANLYRANLRFADLRGADLEGANLEGANLEGAKLDDSEKCRLGIILKKGRVGYKKLRENIVCKILVPKGAVVFSINNSKCRTNKCKVLENGGVSKEDANFIYEVGKKIEIDNFSLHYNVECDTGIHFFWTEEEARNY